MSATDGLNPAHIVPPLPSAYPEAMSVPAPSIPSMTLSYRDQALLHQGITNVRPIPPMRLQRNLSSPVTVVVRINWEHDGPEVLTTRAVAWHKQDVLVELIDPRWPVKGAWLPASDVRRVAPRANSAI